MLTEGVNVCTHTSSVGSSHLINIDSSVRLDKLLQTQHPMCLRLHLLLLHNIWILPASKTAFTLAD